MATFILILIALAIIVVNVSIGIYQLKQKRRYYSLYKAENTKSWFAAARKQMIEFGLEKEININTDFYKDLYKLNTVVMRNPQAYNTIAKVTTKIRLRGLESNPAKAVSLTKKEQLVSLLTARALDKIVIDYAPFLKVLFKTINFLPGNKVTHSHFLNHILHKTHHYFVYKTHSENKLFAEMQIKRIGNELRDLSKSFGPVSTGLDLMPNS